MKTRSPMLFIFLNVFIDLLGVGIVLPLLPYYVKLVEQSGNVWFADNRALLVGGLTAAFSLVQFISVPLLGALSDRYGRRPILLLSLFGTGLSYVLFALADRFIAFGAEAVMLALFVARIIDGFTGANISTAQAYIADITKPEERAKGMGMIGAAFGLGFMLGPAIGGLLAQMSLATPSIVAAVLCFGNVLFGFFNLPESLPVERRSTRMTAAQLNPVTRLQGVLNNATIRPLIIGSMLLSLAFAGLQNNFAVFSDVRFSFGPTDNAFVFALIGVVAVIMQGFLISRLVPRFGEARLAITGMTLMATAFALVALVPQGWMLYPTLALLSIGSGMANPSITSMISRRVSPGQQGATLGGLQAINSLTMIVGPIYAGLVFDNVAISAPYLSGAAFIATAVTIVAVALRTTTITRTLPSMPVTMEQRMRVEL